MKGCCLVDNVFVGLAVRGEYHSCPFAGGQSITLLMLKDSWNDILLALEKSLNPGLFKVWIKPLRAVVNGRSVTLHAPNEFVASWVRDRLAGAIEEAAAQVLGVQPKIEIVASEIEKEESLEVAGKGIPSGEESSRPLGLPIVHVPNGRRCAKWRFTFNDFVVGPCNELAYAASQGLCRDSLPSDSLFLSSGPGLGKTHLLQSIGHMLTAASNKDRLSIACLTAEEFATRLILAIKSREVPRFKAEFRDAVDVLLLEDVHFFQGKEKMQDELLGTLNALQARGCKVVLTSSFLPKDLSKLDSQLISRITSGFLAVIDRPDYETRKRILIRKAKALNVEVPDSVSSLLAERITTDIRQLESCLNNLVLKAKLLNHKVSMELAWEVLDNYALAHSSPDLEHIIEFICKGYDLTRKQLKSKSRKKQIVLARNTAFFLARKHTELSLKDIGEALGRKHSTVLKGITNVEREITMQTPLGRQLEHTVERLTP